MITSRFGKWPQYANVLHRCKNIGHLYQKALKLHHHCSSSLLRSVPIGTVGYVDGRLYSTASSEAHAEQEEAELPLPESTSDNDEESASNYIRNLLYPESEDEMIRKLKSCTNDAEVFDIINGVESPRAQHLVQAALVLRDLYNVNPMYHDEVDVSSRNVGPLFHRLVEQIVNAIPHLNIDELSTCTLFFSKIGVDEDTIFSMVTAYEDKIRNMPLNSISLFSLSRICVVVESFHNIWARYTLLGFLPLLLEKLDSCMGYQDLRRLTVCFQKMRPFLTLETMEAYAKKCSFLLQRNECTEAEFDRLITTLKCVQFLNHSDTWKSCYSQLITDLLLSMHDRIHLLPRKYVHSLHSLTFSLQEPYKILQELKSYGEQNFPKSSSEMPIDLRLINLFYTHHGARNDRRQECVSLLRKYLDSVDIRNVFQLDFIGFLMGLLYEGVKHDQALADKYWNQAFKLMNEKNRYKSHGYILDICTKYMFFNKITSYSNAKFESSASSWLKEIDERNRVVLSPTVRCRMNLLLLYFDFDYDRLESTCQYFVNNVSRFTSETWTLSLGFSCISDRFLRSKKSSALLHYYVTMLSALNNVATDYLKINQDMKIDDLIVLFRTYSYMGGMRSTELYRLMIDRFNKLSSNDLDSKKILLITPTSYISHLFEPCIVDKMIQHFIERKNIVSAYSIISMLKYAYSFGYTPVKCEEFVDVASQLIVRERNDLSAYHLIFGALSLCYYDHFPRQLSEYIFNVEYLEYIDREIPSMKKSRMFLQNFLELNRSACLDFPNSDLPWFHEKYCKEKNSLESGFRSELQRDLSSALKNLINYDEALQVDRYSPYYHKIDFVLYTNKNGEPVDPNACNPSELRKTAILLSTKALSSYYLGKGRMDMKIRQLEILDYKVAVIDGYLWNSMHMAEPTAKENYLCNAIWSKS